MIQFILNHWLLLTLMSTAAVFSFLWLAVINKNLKLRRWIALLVSFGFIVFSFLGSMLLAYIEIGSFGVSAYGAVFITPLYVLVVYYCLRKHEKREYLELLDNFAVVISVFAVLSRINCLVNGCCAGVRIGNTNIRYPTRELDILVNLLFLIFASYNILKKRYQGTHYFLFLVTYGTARFVIEWFRESNSTPFTTLHSGHICSLIALVCGVAVIVTSFFVKKRRGLNNEKQEAL